MATVIYLKKNEYSTLHYEKLQIARYIYVYMPISS